MVLKVLCQQHHAFERLVSLITYKAWYSMSVKKCLRRLVLLVLFLVILIPGCNKEEKSLPAMQTVSAGWFEMGRPYDDQGEADERPVHRVFLDAYAIGRYPVTNAEYIEVLNWALQKGLLQNSAGNPYDGGEIWAYGKPIADSMTTGVGSQIHYGIGTFEVLTQKGKGGEVSMDDHPVQMVTWYGAVVYCNWLSEMHGLTPCYDTETWARIHPVPQGFRLPTEAEWERAAAWDGTRHFRYGVSSDELDFTRANFYGEDYANPLGLDSMPYTSPVDWYNGVNPVSLANPEVKTVSSASPAGCFDMAGNVWEWCHDRYQDNYYSKSGFANPAGPDTGDHRVGRGGSWRYSSSHCRAADRYYNFPDYRSRYQGFRIALSPPMKNQ